jgi:GTP cyclohydrolase I
MVYLQPIYKNMSDNYNQDIASSIKTLLSKIGENPEREGLLKTPNFKSKRSSCGN